MKRLIIGILATFALVAGLLVGVGQASAITVAEQAFVNKARTLPTAAWPNSRYTTDAEMVAGGYRACGVMDRYRDTQVAERIFYNPDGSYQPAHTQRLFLLYATQDLCPRHAYRYENF
ncbi:DUF732 domain-containing protein [Gordonia hongkongensis]|uniref:DUF732 domain-containing protein n=1 Tax=Gordonia hongkongensis TaxID=1701090 RepID=UPI0030D0587F